MTIEETVEIVAKADNWNARIAAIRLIPEQFGTASHQEIYSAIARRIYVPSLAPDFAYIHWHDDYELPLAQERFYERFLRRHCHHPPNRTDHAEGVSVVTRVYSARVRRGDCARRRTK